MFSSVRASIRVPLTRCNSSVAASASASGAKFLTPTELTEKVKADKIQEIQYKEELLSESFTYAPKTFTKETVDPISKRPIPLNVELLQYKPISLEKTHGHKVASITLKGYDTEQLDRAAEFAARAAFYLGIPCGQPVNQRVEEKLFTVIRSPFAQAKSKENFKKYTYGRKLTAYDATAEVVDTWLSFINKHKLDDIQYKAFMYSRESIDFAKQLDALQLQDMKLPSAYEGVEDPVSKKVQELLSSDDFKKYFTEK